MKHYLLFTILMTSLITGLFACASDQSLFMSARSERHLGSVAGWLFLVQPDGHVRVFGENLCLIVASEYRYAVSVPVQERYTEESCAGSTLIEGLNNIKWISAGDDFLLAVDKEGYLWALGKNDRGQMGFSSEKWIKKPTRFPELGKIKDLDAGRGSTLLLTESGQILFWGSHDKNQKLTPYVSGSPIVIPSNASIESVSNDLGKFAVDADGKVFQFQPWKDSHSTELSVPCSVVSITSFNGDTFVCHDGKVYVIGQNAYGDLAMGSVKEVERLTLNRRLEGIIKITGGGPRVAMTENGKFYGWGKQRMPGNETWTNTGYVDLPIRINAPKGAINVFSRSTSVYFLLKDGRVAQLIPEKNWFFDYKDAFKKYHFRYYSY